jgi:hypothetical protein
VDRDTAKNLLKRMVAWDQTPKLTDTDIESLLDMARRADTSGEPITSDDWVPTFNLNAAAAEGWRWKAAEVANLTQFSADGASYHDEQLLAHCTAMARQYASRVAGTLSVSAYRG